MTEGSASYIRLCVDGRRWLGSLPLSGNHATKRSSPPGAGGGGGSSRSSNREDKAERRRRQRGCIPMLTPPCCLAILLVCKSPALALRKTPAPQGQCRLMRQEMTPLRFGKRTKDIPTQHPPDYGLRERLLRRIPFRRPLSRQYQVRFNGLCIVPCIGKVLFEVSRVYAPAPS